MRLVICLTLLVTASNAEQFGRGWWHGRQVTYKVRNGIAIYKGDIMLGRADQIPTAPQDAKSPNSVGSARDAAFLVGNNNANLWPGGIIPYVVDGAITGTALTSLMQAIQGYNNSTPVHWQPRAGEADYVKFSTMPANSGSCGFSDSIGRYGGEQNIMVSLAGGCANLGTFTHEMGHALGLEHEQTRTDRDYYVNVRFENIDKNNAVEYDRDPGQIDVLPYNQGSIMHYGPFDFQRNTLNTIDTIPLGIPIEHRSTLSPGDIEGIRTIYGTASSTTTIYTDPGGLTVIVDGQSVKTPTTVTWAPGSRHTLDIPAGTQPTNNAGTRYAFARWSNDAPASQTVVASPQTRILCANFATQYLVKSGVGKTGGGAVRISPTSSDGFYRLGTLLTVTATSDPGYSFLQWDDPFGISNYHGLSSNPAQFTVNFAGFSYIADFTKSPVTAITTNIPGTVVNVDKTDVYLPANFAWTAGTAHTVTVKNTKLDNGSIGSPYRWMFQSWSDGGAATHNVTATANGGTLSSNWRQDWLVSTYPSDPANGYPTTNGAINVSPGSADCNNPTPTDCYYPAGTKLTFTPAPVAPYVFTNWEGDLSGATLPGSLTVNDQVFLIANFQNPGRLVRTGIVNAANYEGQGVAPGEIITIFGLNFGPPAQLTGAQVTGNKFATTLAQTQVLFDGVAAPLVYVSANQISAIVPYAVAGKASTRVTISYQGRAGNAINVNVLPAHAGLFSADSSGAGLVAALNQNSTIHGVNNPAARGSVIQLFGTGMGITNPGSIDGQLVTPPLSGPVLPVQVLIAGRSAQVMYFGGAPGLVSGVFQANVVVPTDCPTGLVPISVSVGNSLSPATTRIAVQ